ncbi:MAG TPA: hypothetical protein VF009_09025 [Solirubrobacterales bacterium]
MTTATESKAPSPGTIEKGTELSEQVLEQVKESQRSAIEAVRGFMESVDKALPDHGAEPSKRQEIVDSALQMSQKLVKTEYDFLTSVVHSAGEALTGADKKR